MSNDNAGNQRAKRYYMNHTQEELMASDVLGMHGTQFQRKILQQS